jgi:hypothetical protein
MYQFNQVLEGKPFSLAGRGRSPAAGVPCAPPTLAAATILGVNSTRGYCSTVGTVAPALILHKSTPKSSNHLPLIAVHNNDIMTCLT